MFICNHIIYIYARGININHFIYYHGVFYNITILIIYARGFVNHSFDVTHVCFTYDQWLFTTVIIICVGFQRLARFLNR
jgi:hypothetical protein